MAAFAHVSASAPDRTATDAARGTTASRAVNRLAGVARARRHTADGEPGPARPHGGGPARGALGLAPEPAPPMHAISRIPASGGTASRLQPKLTVGSANDRYEKEADRVANRVMAMPAPRLARACECGGECPRCEAARREQGAGAPVGAGPRTTSAGGTAPPAVNRALRTAGEPLDTATRAFFEPRFGHDLSAIRVHSGPVAAQAAAAVGARAFTVGNRIVFGGAEPAPGRSGGRRLLAHELTHAVQQGATEQLSPAFAAPVSTQADGGPPVIRRRTLGIAGACWFQDCESQLDNFFMIPEDGPPGFHPSGGSSFRVDDVDGLWFKFHVPKSEWFKIPDIGTGWVTCKENEQEPEISSPVIPFATAGWVSDSIHTPNPY